MHGCTHVTMGIVCLFDEVLHLCCWEESGPQASGEEESSLLSLCNHFPGQCCIHLQAHPHTPFSTHGPWYFAAEVVQMTYS